MFDDGFASMAGGELLWQLAAEAYGEEYPAEVQPWGMTTWWTLGHRTGATVEVATRTAPRTSRRAPIARTSPAR
jgi:hypothetical protein